MMIEVAIGICSVVGVFVLFLLGLLMKRLSEIDAKLDKHISESEGFRADVKVLKDRWDRWERKG